MNKHSPFIAAYTNGSRFLPQADLPIVMRTKAIGVLQLPTGNICVGDPFLSNFDGDQKPLAGLAPIGEFPVELALAHFETKSDLRVACARIRFNSDRPAVRWEMAILEGQPKPAEDQIAGYGVDTGTGCFHDAAARDEKFTEAVGDQWVEQLERNQVNTYSWYAAPLGPANVVMFSSGWGDGFYASYWGFDANDVPVELVTDFEVLMGPAFERFELSGNVGPVKHALLERFKLEVEAFPKHLIVRGQESGRVNVTVSDNTKVQRAAQRSETRYSWDAAAPSARVTVEVLTQMVPLEPITQ